MAKRRKRTKKVAKKKVAKRPVGRPRGSTSARTSAPATSGVAQDINAAIGKLMAQRNSIDSQIALLQRTLSELGAAATVKSVGRPAGPGRGRRGPRAGSLKEYIENVLSAAGGEMAVKDIAEGVVANGYKSKNKTLAKSVGIALTQMANVQKVGRGTFKLR